MKYAGDRRATGVQNARSRLELQFGGMIESGAVLPLRCRVALGMNTRANCVKMVDRTRYSMLVEMSNMMMLEGRDMALWAMRTALGNPQEANQKTLCDRGM